MRGFDEKKVFGDARRIRMETEFLKTEYDQANNKLIVDFQGFQSAFDLFKRRAKVGDEIQLYQGPNTKLNADRNSGKVLKIDDKGLKVEVQILD